MDSYAFVAKALGCDQDSRHREIVYAGLGRDLTS